MKLEELESYDWEQVFCCAGEVLSDGCCHNHETPQAVAGESISTSAFARADVARIVAASEGENDGPDWLIVVELRDGRFGFISAGCDYTGWDCQSGGSSWVAGSLESLVQFGLGDSARDRLGLAVAA